MVSYSRTDMKVPVRPAPAPPTNKPSRIIQPSPTTFDLFDDGNNDLFTKVNYSKSLAAQQVQPLTVKKKPPPRPPPPKFNQQKQSSSRPGDVFSGLFSRRPNSRGSHPSSLSQKQSAPKEPVVMTAPLIDFHSPSISPTPTTRSSSDGVSVNSFGSDGSASNNGLHTIGGTISIFDNGFEDDFDFFGGLSTSHVKTPITEQTDPWSTSPQDPFSPPRQLAENIPKSTLWVENPTNESPFKNKASSAVKPPPINNTMPTIIRAKPSRPAALPKSLQNIQNTKSNASHVSSHMKSIENSAKHTFNKVNSECFDASDCLEDSRDSSPPMPSIPPPPPPPEALQEFQGQNPPDIPPRPFQLQQPCDKPYGIALYDYPSSHPDDLSLKVDDLVFITRKVNEEWFYGHVNDCYGMFPANFIKVIIPLAETKILEDKPALPTVVALYPFSAETWEDLDFPEGAVIEVLSQINSDWLYGKYEEKSGQFPSSFVDHIPFGLPQQKV